MSHLPLRTVSYIQNEFEKTLNQYTVKEHPIDSFEKILIIEDSLVLYVGKVINPCPVCLNADEIFAWTANTEYMDIPVRGENYYRLHIEELTYDEIGFKHKHGKFLQRIETMTKIKHLNIDVSYSKFKGYSRLYWCLESETLAEQVNNAIPSLRLRERYEAWDGILYHFIVLEFEAANGAIEYAVAYTNQKPYSFVRDKCHEWIKRGFNVGDMRGSYNGLKETFSSWKGTSRQYRLENHLRYFSVERHFREKDDVWRHADDVLNQARSNDFSEIERSTYFRPVNRWVTEELVFRHTKKLYKQHSVIYQHRPFFLVSNIGGRMSYDIFITGLNVAIEYQGKQHFEPIEFFGGEESYRKTVERDKLKKQLSEEFGVKLAYINCWENITPELISTRVSEALQLQQKH